MKTSKIDTASNIEPKDVPADKKTKVPGSSKNILEDTSIYEYMMAGRSKVTCKEILS